MLYYLIYCSVASELMAEEDLRVLLKQARARNRELVITGMLVYVEGGYGMRRQGRFMQVLEGSRFLVETLFEKIRNDNRHHEVVVLEEGAIHKRSFKTWEMGFERTEQFPPADASFSFLKSFYDERQDRDVSA
ncbi:FAD-dependent sensor of blue light [Arcticibacter pallidicorallinus]|uniref:FAD-dependent sensor of blue light n=1 Tax=Arcticibacter pallidicorallinus TaxID=1259464 RepID=A0A2T0UBK5_9SPHI|nr:BLUF domain-containing protein [Arcticibacter pallidicorallinus]PRY55299.1 FAD-dependent sensor of blue light [Arcticibacter pallidicorallinus]